MSHYTTIRTELRDKDVILEALKLMGFSYKIGKNLPLYDFSGRRTLRRADIVIPQKSLSMGSNDLGIRKAGECYEVIISDFDLSATKTRDFVTNLLYRYSYLKVRKELAISGFKVAEEKILQDNSIQIIAETQEA